ncbi:MAG: hypothetical protein JWL89_73 [Candidatus Saccharibacteria bacterium]|nr:hypothetical protein [Candidatus Saccharibacteria bacterium]
MADEQTDPLIPDEDVVDDRNTIEGQLIGHSPHPRLSNHIMLQIQKYLDGLNYPATKYEVQHYAASRGAGKQIIAALDRLQGSSYQNYNAISNELSK